MSDTSIAKQIGKLSGSGSVAEIRYSSVLESVDELISAPPTDEFLAPGFIDAQVNGFAGVDYNEPSSSHGEIGRSIRVMFATGVTRFFPTIITGSPERIIGSLANLAKAKQSLPEGAAMEAFHVEGPHISAVDGPRGAHPREWVRPPDLEEFKRWQEAAEGHVKLVTVSPEWPETPAYTKELVRQGVVVSIGHMNAEPDQVKAAVDAGATMSTHLGNGSHAVLHKTSNYIWAQLSDDRLTASFITDGIHIPECFFKSAVRAKGTERSVLVTDAVMPAMCKPGLYRLGSVDVELQENGSVVLRGGTRLAGSALRMDHAVGNAVRLGGITLQEAIAMATTNAARVTRISGRQRGLVPGERADLVRFKWNEAEKTLTVHETILDGRSVYRSDA